MQRNEVIKEINLRGFWWEIGRNVGSENKKIVSKDAEGEVVR